MTSPPNDRKSTSDRTRERAATRDAIPAVVLLLVAQGSLILADPGPPETVAETLWALSPLVPIAWLAWGQYRALQRADERQRVLQLEAMAIGFGVFAVLLGGVGVLQGAEIGDPAQQVQITFIAGILAWVVASAMRSRSDA